MGQVAAYACVGVLGADTCQVRVPVCGGPRQITALCRRAARGGWAAIRAAGADGGAGSGASPAMRSKDRTRYDAGSRIRSRSGAGT